MKIKTTFLTLPLLLLPLAGCESASRADSKPAPTAGADNAAVPAIPVGTKTKCPVSGEDFTVKEKTQQVVYKGKRYAFCCADCRPEFEKNPAKYAK